jgi:DNA-binding response OmpR family regulator
MPPTFQDAAVFRMRDVLSLRSILPLPPGEKSDESDFCMVLELGDKSQRVAPHNRNPAMKDQQFSALVVDDEPALRRLTATALSRFNFSCDEATDGDEAASLLCRRKYDVVVTDLRMPKRNGHALAVELLAAGGERPIIVVLTGVLEPRLAEDLITRGVDEVEFKPVNFALFGAKIRARCERRSCQQIPSAKSAEQNPVTPTAAADVPSISNRVTLQQLGERLTTLSVALPVSSAAIDVANLVQDQFPDLNVVAKCIARDSGLTAELLKIANSAYYNPSGQLSDDLHSAILRLGHRKIGELALASANLQLLAKSTLPWIDPEVVWRRCLATGRAIEHLYPGAKLGGDDESLFLSAIFMPMSRVLTGLAFPEVFRNSFELCQATGSSLRSLEQETLDFTPEAAMAVYLERAGLSPRLYKSLRHSATPYAKLDNLTEPLRTAVSRLLVGAALGDLVVGQWAAWDEIGFPPAALMRQVEANHFNLMVDRLRADLARLAVSGSSAKGARATAAGDADGLAGKEIRYFKLTVEPYDLLLALVETLGMKPIHVSRAQACCTEPVLVNCLDVSDERLTQFVEECQPGAVRVLVGNDAQRPATSSRASYVATPCSFGCLAAQLRTAVVGT